MPAAQQVDHPGRRGDRAHARVGLGVRLDDQAVARHPDHGALDRDGAGDVVDPGPVQRQQLPDPAAQPGQHLDQVAQIVPAGGVGRGEVRAQGAARGWILWSEAQTGRSDHESGPPQQKPCVAGSNPAGGTDPVNVRTFGSVLVAVAALGWVWALVGMRNVGVMVFRSATSILTVMA